MSVPGEFNQIPVQYTADTGQVFSISQKRSNAVAVGNLILPIRGQQGIPARWRLRYIIAVTIFQGKFYKREIIIGRSNNPVFRGDRGTILLDGMLWMVTSRKGESRRG